MTKTDPEVSIIIRNVPESVRRALKSKAAAEGKPMNKVILELITRYVGKEVGKWTTRGDTLRAIPPSFFNPDPSVPGALTVPPGPVPTLYDRIYPYGSAASAVPGRLIHPQRPVILHRLFPHRIADI